jgi:hypothetical protein
MLGVKQNQFHGNEIQEDVLTQGFNFVSVAVMAGT